jgi:succinyl-diaminopimelate desuccinylase
MGRLLNVDPCRPRGRRQTVDYADVLARLISIDTSVSPELDPSRNYLKTIEYLDPLFAEAGFETQRVAIPREHADGRTGRINLLAHRRNPGRPRLIFYTHIDTVPAQGWAAFTPRMDRDRIYGRGAADMKGAIASLLLGLQIARDRDLKYDTSVMVTTDEETSQASQIRYLGQSLRPLSGAYFFSLDSSFGYISIAALGVVQMDIRVKGRSVHSGMSHLGENAVEKAAPVLNALLDLKEKVTQRRSRVPVSPGTGLTVMEPRLNINVIRGGLKVNIVPDECTISVDRRLIPEEDAEQAERELIQTLTSVKGVEWEIDDVVRIPTVPALEDPVIDELVGLLREVTGQGNAYGEMGSGDFGPVVRLEWGAKLFGLGVIRADCNIHGKDEFVYRRDIEDLAVVISRFIAPD